MSDESSANLQAAEPPFPPPRGITLIPCLSSSVCGRLSIFTTVQEEARADLQAATAALEKERQQAVSASTSEPEALPTAAATAAKPRSNTAVIDSDSDFETAAPAGKHSACTGLHVYQ